METESLKKFIQKQERITQKLIGLANIGIPPALSKEKRSIIELTRPYRTDYVQHNIGQELTRLYGNINQPSIFEEVNKLHNSIVPNIIYHSDNRMAIQSYMNFENRRINSLSNPILSLDTTNQQLSALTTKLSQSFIILQKRLNNSLDVPNEILAYFRLSSLDWPIPMSFSLPKKFLNNISKMTDEEVNSYMINKLKKDNYRLLKDEMNMLINAMNDLDFKEHLAFKKQVKKIKDCFDHDTESIICFAPTLFSLLEYLNLNGKYFPSLKNSNIVNHHFFENVTNNISITRESMLFVICEKLYKTIKNEKYDFDSYGLNRHMVEHGFLSPQKISIKEFAQLIIICNGFAHV